MEKELISCSPYDMEKNMEILKTAEFTDDSCLQYCHKKSGFYGSKMYHFMLNLLAEKGIKCVNACKYASRDTWLFRDCIEKGYPLPDSEMDVEDFIRYVTINAESPNIVLDSVWSSLEPYVNKEKLSDLIPIVCTKIERVNDYELDWFLRHGIKPDENLWIDIQKIIKAVPSYDNADVKIVANLRWILNRNYPIPEPLQEYFYDLFLKYRHGCWDHYDYPAEERIFSGEEMRKIFPKQCSKILDLSDIDDMMDKIIEELDLGKKTAHELAELLADYFKNLPNEQV